MPHRIGGRSVKFFTACADSAYIRKKGNIKGKQKFGGVFTSPFS